MSKKIEKIRVKGTQIRNPAKAAKDQDNLMSVFGTSTDSTESQDTTVLRIKHIELAENFVECAPLYDLVITNFNDKDWRVLRYTKQDGTSEFFTGNRLGLISKRAVDLLSITSL